MANLPTRTADCSDGVAASDVQGGVYPGWLVGVPYRAGLGPVYRVQGQYIEARSKDGPV